jgi:hypothetical protein
MARKKKSESQAVTASADLEIRARGEKAEELLEAQTRPESSEGNGHKKKEESKLEKIIGLLQDPQNLVVVRRHSPKHFQGQPCAFEVYRSECPTSIEDIKGEVFKVFGGHKFQVRVLDSDGRTLDAMVIENPDTTTPAFPGAGTDPTQDPFLEPPPEPQPIEEMEASLKKEISILQKRNELENLQEMLADMKQGRKRGEVPPKDDGKIEALEKRIEEMLKGQREDVLLQKIAELEKKIETKPAVDPEKEALQRRIEGLEKRKEEDSQTSMIAKLIESSENKFNKVIEMIQSQQQNALAQKLDAVLTQREPREDFDTMVDRMAKLKTVMGGGEDGGSGKSKRVEELIWDLALNQIHAGGGRGLGEEEEEDTIKFAIKQMVPVIRDWAKKEVETKQKEGQTVSQEQLRQIIGEQAKKAAMELEARHRTAQPPRIMPPPQAAQLPPRPQQQPQGQPRPQQQPQPPTPPTVARPPLPPPPPANPKPTPPPPRAYDRKDAVNYVLRTLWKEMNAGLPRDSEALGDALDTFDDELLDEFEKIETGEQMEALLKPYADEQVWQQILNRTKEDEPARKWLRNLVFTLQQAWEMEKKEDAKDQDAEGAPPPAPERF